MIVRIVRGSPVPISRQIDAQVRAQILAGKLRPGDQLPSVRLLASELAINVNTVARVYGRLSADGLIELRHGNGTFVTQRRKSAVDAQLGRRRREFSQELDALVRRALMLGIAVDELPVWLAESTERIQKDVAFVDSYSSGLEKSP
jgi:GntR family transcriptional regulator